MAGTFMDYLLPTAVETPAWETGKTITPSPHHPIGAKGVGESATVGAPPAIANAVVDALWHLGVRNIDIPITPQKVWAILHEKGIALGRAMGQTRSIFARAAELEAAGRSFAVATVVAVQRPTSARPGASGIVHPDGTIEGWVGGSCAQPVVVREALRSMGDGQPRLLRLSKDAPAEGRRGDGVIELVMTCHSGGTLEIYVEPHLPAPVLWVAGTTPIAGALAALGAAAGWRVTVIDPVADADAFPSAERVMATADIKRLDPERRAVHRRRDPGGLGRGGHGGRPRPRGLVRGPGRLADAGQRRPRRGCTRRPASRTSGWRRCAPRPASTSAPRPPRRSRCRSSPSSSRSVAAARRSSPRRVRRRSPAASRPRSTCSRSSTTSSCSTRSAA